MEHEEAREQAMLAMQSEDWRVRAAAVRGYGWLDDVREHAALRDADWRVRFLAVRQQSWEDPPAFMEAVANDPKPDVRKAAVPLLRDNPIWLALRCWGHRRRVVRRRLPLCSVIA
jgi:HEAT repeat protein